MGAQEDGWRGDQRGGKVNWYARSSASSGVDGFARQAWVAHSEYRSLEIPPPRHGLEGRYIGMIDIQMVLAILVGL